MILASFLLFALEAKFATHGVLAIGGIATLTLGGLLLVDSPIPEMRVHLTDTKSTNKLEFAANAPCGYFRTGIKGATTGAALEREDYRNAEKLLDCYIP